MHLAAGVAATNTANKKSVVKTTGINKMTAIRLMRQNTRAEALKLRPWWAQNRLIVVLFVPYGPLSSPVIAGL